MKTYSNIEELYREEFSAYTPEPPAEVWERIQQSEGKKSFVKGKAAIVAATAIIAAIVGYWGISTFSPEKISVENTQKEQVLAKNTPSEKTDIVEEKAVVAQNEPSKAIAVSVSPAPSQETAQEPQKEAGKTENPASTNTSTYHNVVAATSNNNEVPVSANPPKVEAKAAAESKKPKGNTEAVSAKVPPIVIEEDAAEVENTVVEIFVPSAFTPNGDGLNDVFSVKSNAELTYFEMSIYAGDGTKLLFSCKDINSGWEGTYNGVLQPHGAYICVIRYKDNTGKMQLKKERFLLILQ